MTETLVRLMGLYFLLSGIADVVYGIVQMVRFRASEFAEASGLYWLGGLGPVLLGGLILALSRPLAEWAHCEERELA